MLHRVMVYIVMVYISYGRYSCGNDVVEARCIQLVYVAMACMSYGLYSYGNDVVETHYIEE